MQRTMKDDRAAPAPKERKRHPTRSRRIMLVTMITVLACAVLIALTDLSTTVAAENYAFGSETVLKGSTQNPANRDAADGLYEQLIEGDQYMDSNFSGSTETVTTGTAGGGSFPTAFDTDDATRRSYTEADGNPSDYTATLVPTSDVSIGFDATYPTSPTDHYSKVDDGVTNDGDSTYNTAVTNADRDVFGLTDLTAPSGTPDLDVVLHYWAMRAATGTNSMDVGLRIGSTDYVGIDNANAGAAYAELTYTWEANPATASEWTDSDIDALTIYMQCDDATPDVKVTSTYLVVTVDYTANYRADVTVTYSSVTSVSQTTGYRIICQGYRSSTENFGVYAWDYTGGSWTLKTTVQAAGDTDYNFNLLSSERSSSLNEVKLRVVDLTQTSDSTQDIVYLDLMKVCRVDKGYALEVEMTASSVNQYGEEQLRIKGYTTAESFYVHVYNWTASSYDTARITVTATSNTLYTFNLIETYHRSGTQQVKVRFQDATDYSADTTQDTLYLDLADVTWVHTDPEVSDTGAVPLLVNEGESITFWLTYTDIDNEAPSYVYVNIASTDYSMTANNSGDTAYYDSKDYYYTTSALAVGEHDYYFHVKDANSGDIMSSTLQLMVNGIPTLTVDGVDPATGSSGQVFSFYVTYTDEDNDSPSYAKVSIGGVDYNLEANDSEDLTYSDGKAYHYDKMLTQGSYSYYFRTLDYASDEVTTASQNLQVRAEPTITQYNAAPAQVNLGASISFWLTYTDADDDAPSYVQVRIDSTDYALTANDSEDLTYTDGKAYFLTKADLIGGTHGYYFAVKDAYSDEVVTSAQEVTINRIPTLTADQVQPTTGNNGDGFQFTVTYSDLDNNAPTLIKVVVDSTEYTMSEVDTGDTTYTDGKGYYYDKVMAGGDHTYRFRAQDYLSGDVLTMQKALAVNNMPTLSGYSRLPADPVYPTTELTFSVIYTDLDDDAPSSIKWREGAIQNITMTEVDPLDLVFSDGKAYHVQLSLSHGSHDYDFYASDGHVGSIVSGGSDSVTVTNRAPTIDNAPGSTTTYRGTYWSWDVSASDLDGDDVVYTEWDNCSFTLSIDPDTGLLSGTTGTALGWYQVWVWANDTYGGTDSYGFQLTVVNRAPAVTSAGNTTQGMDTYMAYHVLYSDPDSDPCALDLATNASFVFLDGDWVQGTCSESGWFWLKVWCNDSYGGSDLEQWQLTVSNQAPYFTSTPIYSVQNGSWYSYDANATDLESEVTYVLATNASWLSVDEVLGFVNGTVGAVGTFWVNITASDGELTCSANYTLTTLNTLPVVTTFAVEGGELGVPYIYDCDASDVNGDTLVFSLEDGPVWLFVNPSTGEVEGTPTAAGVFDVSVSIWDGYGYVYDEYTLTVTGNEEEPEEPEESDVVPPLPPGPPPIYDEEPLLDVSPAVGLGILLVIVLGATSMVITLFIRQKRSKQSRKKM